MLVKAGVPGLGIQDEEETVEAEESRVPVGAQLGLAQLQRRGDLPPVHGIGNERGDGGLGGPEDGLFEVIGHPLGVLPALGLDPLHGPPALIIGKEVGRSEELHKSGEGLRICLLCEPRQIRLQVGPPRPLALSADEARPLPGEEEPVGEALPGQ